MEAKLSEFYDLFNEDDDARPLHIQPDIETTLQELQSNVQGSANATIFYGLSGILPEQIGRIEQVWIELAPEYRRKLMQQLIDVSETNFELDYRSIGIMALADHDAEVREKAIELLWEDETLELMDRLIEMAQWDEAVQVRSAAVGALGRFILLGELGSLSETESGRAQDVAVAIYSTIDEDVEVRRRALEAIANCGHEIVPEAITEAYESDDPRMQASALFAMGRTCDTHWNEIVLREINNSDPAIRYEAARASGELEIEEAVPYLARLTQGRDREIKEVAIWALGEIGGNDAMTILSALADAAEQADDEDLLEAVEEAISSASMAGRDFDFDFDD